MHTVICLSSQSGRPTCWNLQHCSEQKVHLVVQTVVAGSKLLNFWAIVMIFSYAVHTAISSNSLVQRSNTACASLPRPVNTFSDKRLSLHSCTR